MTKSEPPDFIRRLNFPSEMESAFQENYYARVRPTMRVSIFFLVGVGILLGVLDFVSNILLRGPLRAFGGPVSTVIISLLVLWLALRRDFVQFWQPLVVAATLGLFATSVLANNDFSIFLGLVCLILIGFRVQHLQTRWMALQLLGVLAIGSLFSLTHRWEWYSVIGSLFGSLVVMSIPLYVTVKNERFERREFFNNYLLAQERNTERLKREQTEKMLHVLSQAIGGIVHDLGNPLTAVQGGAETLLQFVKEGDVDKELIQEFAEMITDGAQMLNYLRLSLMEQTRVLEGKPVPVELGPVGMRDLVKAGAHYQKPRFSSGRKVILDGEELEVCVDEMRFITVFMNLIGNALKYSDGEVRITWRTAADRVLVAVLDQGQKGHGISQAQAEKLFVPFGRLDTHAQVEGTGLGLLSVRKIAEAHSGEVYIEGHSDGTVASATFSTAQGTYPEQLQEGFVTAFVTAFPQKTMA